MGDGLRLALTTLTVAPLRPGRVDRTTARTSILLAPLVGLGLGLAAAGLGALARELWPGTLVPAVVAVAALAAGTRGLHLDGLADTADGLGAPTSRALAVMRSPEIGPFGVVTLVLVLLGQVMALDACYGVHRGSLSLVLAVALGRVAIVLACSAGVPAARPDGLGALVAGTAPRRAWLVWALALVVGLGGLAVLDDGAGPGGLLRVAAAVVAGLGVAAALLRHAVRRLGGVTGDVLGALVEVSTLVALLVLGAHVGPDGS